MYSRAIEENILNHLNKPEVIVLLGARQTGKSTLLEILSSKTESFKILNCENTAVYNTLAGNNINNIIDLFDSNTYIAFDEAQTVPEIGKLLKLLFDDKSITAKFIATGSSSLDLSNKTGEPLTGRNINYKLFPFSIAEISFTKGWLHILENYKELLIYGSYPGVVDLNREEKREKLLSLTSDYLFKDIFKFEQLRNPELLRKLLKAIALQIGSQVSLHELSNLLGIAKQTVERYLDLLEKSYVIFKLGSYSSNLRNEIKKSHKYYFYDTGIRNAIINNFANIDDRTDNGAIWENFCVSEIIKSDNNSRKFSNFYFWRTYDGAEIDLIQERDGEINAYEFKWNLKRKPSLPKSFKNAYNVKIYQTISPQEINFFKAKEKS
jgi:uncharacterized protein